MLKEEQIYHLITSNSCPYWKLFLQENQYSKPQIIANYNLDNIPEDSKEDARIKASIESLQSQLSIYKDVPGISFKITIRGNKTSSGDGILGPFAFAINGSEEMPLGNIAGQAGAGMGMVPKNQMNEMLELMAQKSAFLVEKALFERDKKAFEEEMVLAENDIKDRAKEYSNVYNAAKSASKKGIMEAGFKLAKLAGIIDEDVELGGVDDKPDTHQENDTPEEKAAIKIAELLVAENLSVNDIDNIHALIVKLIEKKRNNGTETDKKE